MHTAGRAAQQHSGFSTGKSVTPALASARAPTVEPKVVVLGLAKSGTSSLYEFFKCGGEMTISHGTCRGGGFCGPLFRRASESGLPLFQTSGGHYSVFTQLDYTPLSKQSPWYCYWPQVELLPQMAREAPSATFVLNFRSAHSWVKSITDWHLSDGTTQRYQLQFCNITGMPHGQASDAELEAFYDGHIARVQEFFRSHRSLKLLEIDIESDGVGDRLARGFAPAFNISASCWGVHNSRQTHPARYRMRDNVKGRDAL